MENETAITLTVSRELASFLLEKAKSNIGFSEKLIRETKSEDQLKRGITNLEGWKDFQDSLREGLKDAEKRNS
jgi:hypothetical protein